MIKILVIILSLFSFLGLSQQKEIKELDDLIKISNDFLRSNLDSAYANNKKAFELNKKIGNQYYQARCTYNFANISYLSNEKRDAIKKANEAIFLANKSSNYKILLRANHLLGLINYENSEFNQSLEHYQIALKYANITKEEWQMASVYSGLGNLFLSKKDSTKALENYKIAENYAKIAKDVYQEFGVYNNIALIYSKKNPDTAIHYFDKALGLALANDMYNEAFDVYINKSDLFFEKDTNKMYESLNNAEKLSEKVDKNKLFYLYYNFGGYYNYKKDYQKALSFYNKAIDLFNTKYFPFEQKISLLEGLSKTYEKNGDYVKAYYYASEFHKAKDSIFSIEKEKDFNKLFTKYEVEKKNNQIQLLSKEKEIEKQKKYFWIGSLFLALLFSIIFFGYRFNNQKKISLKNQELKHSQGIIEGQTAERNRVSKELHDGVAGSLIGIRYLLEHENKSLNNPKIIDIQENINTIYDEVREISHDMNNSYIESKGFKELIYRLKMSYERKKIFQTEIYIFPDNALEKINGEVKIDLYRIFQEIFTNIEKHSRAKNVEITITENNRKLNIIIENDGRKFTENSTEGIGIRNIKSRLNKYYGHINYENQRKEGVTCLINIQI